MISMDEQIATYEAILAEGVKRLKAMGFSPRARPGMGAAGQEIAGVAEEIGQTSSSWSSPSGRWRDGWLALSAPTWSSIFAAVFGGPNRNQRRSICPADGGRRAGVVSGAQEGMCRDCGFVAGWDQSIRLIGDGDGALASRVPRRTNGSGCTNCYRSRSKDGIYPRFAISWTVN